MLAIKTNKLPRAFSFLFRVLSFAIYLYTKDFSILVYLSNVQKLCSTKVKDY